MKKKENVDWFII